MNVFILKPWPQISSEVLRVDLKAIRPHSWREPDEFKSEEELLLLKHKQLAIFSYKK